MHVIQGKCSFDSSQSGKLKIYGSGTVSTSSCMFRMETNGETDHLQRGHVETQTMQTADCADRADCAEGPQ